MSRVRDSQSNKRDWFATWDRSFYTGKLGDYFATCFATGLLSKIAPATWAERKAMSFFT